MPRGKAADWTNIHPYAPNLDQYELENKTIIGTVIE
jgi:hypothetical protein